MRKLPLSLLLLTVLLIGTVAPAYSAPAQRETTLKMGLLPILDVLPFYVADQAGYFRDAGLKVELIPASSAVERDQLMLAGEIDGMLNDLISTGIFNQDEARIQVVAQARRAYAESPQFRILAAPRSNITIPSDLKGIAIGVSENSVIKYMTQRILENAGLSASDLKFIAEPNIAVRYQLLMEGTMKAACLPDPMAQAAIAGGAILIADDSSLLEAEFSQSVLTFSTKAIKDKPEAVSAFLTAWMQAAADINADPEAYRELWLEKTNVPDSVKDTYQLPPFPTYAITQPLAWEDTMAWLVEQEIIDEAPAYEDSVNGSFLAAISPMVAITGDPTRGQNVFTQNGCAACHDVTNNSAGAGPSLVGIASRAGSEVEGLSAEDYLRQSIIDPNAYVVEGFSGIMPPYNALSDGDLNDLIGYLMTLQ